MGNAQRPRRAGCAGGEAVLGDGGGEALPEPVGCVDRDGVASLHGLLAQGAGDAAAVCAVYLIRPTAPGCHIPAGFAASGLRSMLAVVLTVVLAATDGVTHWRVTGGNSPAPSPDGRLPGG